MSRHVRMTQDEFDALQWRARAKHGIPEPDPPQEIKFVQMPRRNKYNARKTSYNGRRYDSAMEARAARRLDMLVSTGKLASWKPQVAVVVAWPGTHEVVLRCRLDFQLTHTDGRVTYLEVKGVRTEAWVLRHRILRLAGIPLEVEGGKASPSRSG